MPDDRNKSEHQWPRPADDYAYILTLSDAELAWEFLRRNPEYQNSYSTANADQEARSSDAERRRFSLSERDAAARRWGLSSFRRPGTTRAEYTDMLAFRHGSSNTRRDG